MFKLIKKWVYRHQRKQRKQREQSAQRRQEAQGRQNAQWQQEQQDQRSHWKQQKPFAHNPNHAGDDGSQIPVSNQLQRNKEKIREILGYSQDIIMRDFQMEREDGTFVDALVLGIDGLIDETAVRENVLTPLMSKPLDKEGSLIERTKQRLYLKNFKLQSDLNQMIIDVLKGSAILLIDGYAQGFVLKIEGFEVRSIAEPPSEAVVKGPREGFVESIATNTALLRRRIQNPALRFESLTVGQYTKSNVTIAYIEGIADPQVIERLKARLGQIQTDSILSSGQLEQHIEDTPYTIFPTVGNTERPDKTAAMMLEGRIAILVDGDPVALIVPYLFIQGLQNQEDYSSRPYYATFVRLLRLLAFIISSTFPSFYYMAMSFHKELIPSELIVSFSEARQKVPFPLFMELVGLMLAFEIVREAGVRMPRVIGQAVSIVGALILGQVSVQAGLIGAPTIIVVAVSAISSFIITPIAEVATLLRFLLVIVASFFGFFGILPVLLAILTHMASLTSMGVPYLAPIAPFYFKDWKDLFVRLPFPFLRERPNSIPNLRKRRIEQLPDRRGDSNG